MSEAPDETIPANPKAKARAEQVKAKHDGPQILIMHDAERVYTCQTLEELEGLTNTKQQRFRNHHLILWPGLNYVAQSLFEMQETNVRFAEKQKMGLIVEVENFAKARPKKIYDWLKVSAHVPTLEKLRDAEKRDDVRKAIAEHIEDCIDTSGKRLQARAAQRAHNRRK